MTFSGIEGLDYTLFLLLLFATHSIQKHSFHPCSCVSGSSHNDIFSFVFAHWSTGWSPYSMLSGAGVMWGALEKAAVTGHLAAWLLGTTLLCVVQESFICAGKLPFCLTSERTGSQAWRGHYVRPVYWLVSQCPSVSVLMRPLRFSMGMKVMIPTCQHLWWAAPTTHVSGHLSFWTYQHNQCQQVPFEPVLSGLLALGRQAKGIKHFFMDDLLCKMPHFLISRRNSY